MSAKGRLKIPAAIKEIPIECGGWEAYIVPTLSYCGVGAEKSYSGFQLDQVHARNPVTLAKPGFSVPHSDENRYIYSNRQSV
jgi:hypothetical protein